LKISELKEIKTIRRPTKEFDGKGNRVFEEVQVEVNVAVTFEEKNWPRYFAKLIDLIPLIIVLYLLFEIHFFLIFCSAIILNIILGAISESLSGRTLGKRIFNLRVVNDFGKSPAFHQSLIRNFLFILTFDGSTSILFRKLLDKYGIFSFVASPNNSKARIFVVDKEEYEKIKKLLVTRTD